MNRFCVSLIGTGGGYGESIVVQLCEHNWMVVDSCQDPATGVCLPLSYLEEKGINVETDVKLIVCTHWHDDHIAGMDKLLSACKSAAFCIAIVSDKEKYLRYIGFESREDKMAAGTASTTMMMNCLNIISKRKQLCKKAIQDKQLLNIVNDDIHAEVFSLSPSEKILDEFQIEIIKRISNESPNSSLKATSRSPNDKSIALLIKVNNHSVILGADLEKSNSDDRGWLCVLNCECLKGSVKSELFKIPHHGSDNAYEEKIWETLIKENAIGQIAPFINGSISLPTTSMLETYLGHTGKLYITSSKFQLKQKKRDRNVEMIINQFNKTLKEVRFAKGIIESYIDLDNEQDGWHTNLIDSALQITPDFIEKLK